MDRVVKYQLRFIIYTTFKLFGSADSGTSHN
jgi:hypothetical protein